MARRSLLGSRIRERRGLLGLRQAELARAAGVSASYLNLIEHNRRRVSEDLLDRIAHALGTETAALSEGGEARVIDGLRLAAAGGAARETELDRLEEFAGRFPGWAGLLAAQARQVQGLERAVETLTDRLAHDPYLSTALHEVLSAITSIRTTAEILAETDDIDPAWRARFHGNLRSDSERLAHAAEALVDYLDNVPEERMGLASPQEEVENWLEGRGYHFPLLEGSEEPARLLTEARDLAGASASARLLAERHLERYREDARLMPEQPFRALWAEAPDPTRLAARFGVPTTAVLRRAGALLEKVGFVLCDASGTLSFRRPLPDFPLPRFGAGCPLWPIYRALSRPGEPISARVEMAGRSPRIFRVWAAAERRWPDGFAAGEVVEAAMLLLPDEGSGPPLPVGTGCRVCPRAFCIARREPSILTQLT
ncbi:XRE family transcriptional regulator [Haematobacter massiliensis]|uniref:XRE family transcriptional regulator n=1 Tax=Haematobacter massiliensis TaxID=195105 RepID=A0A086YB07_9RHOB|nr:helix-turn-helix transcriptional regulator [Haematobacter massiliensis]KFI31457.1 XRE family transcriptional regulator [Haematobacter massiliensis]OWJ71642.1 XRE family transcriptional regulator [Haematobacter massiliensis]OWJ88080.1 XRE family transcriptional regulator [Haematobacter massiliensis]QBJ23538.1 XRE family transcriptional regulator [Haematobacter massiliensis]